MWWISSVVNLCIDCLQVICFMSPVTSSLSSSSSVKQEKWSIGYIFHGNPVVTWLLSNPVIWFLWNVSANKFPLRSYQLFSTQLLSRKNKLNFSAPYGPPLLFTQLMLSKTCLLWLGHIAPFRRSSRLDSINVCVEFVFFTHLTVLDI